MPTVRTRQRLNALGRKGAYESAFLFDDEAVDYVTAQPLKLKDQPESTTTPSSPVSVASFLDAPGAPDAPIEIKSLTLPGAWVVVGKGGKPVKNEKMYDEPVLKSKGKKKKKKARKAVEPEPLLVALEDAGSSSKCLRELERSTSRRHKEMARAKDVKYWAAYQHAKQLRRGALDELVAALSLDDGEGEAAPLENLPATRDTTRRDHKANSSKDKARRRARAAAAAVRCEIWQDDEPSVSLERAAADAAPSSATKRLMSGEFQLVTGPRVTPKPPGAWTTVGKRGKAVSDFPPLQPRDVKAAEPKRLAVPKRAPLSVDSPTEPKRVAAPTETSDSKPRKLARKTSHEASGSKGMKCSVM